MPNYPAPTLAADRPLGIAAPGTPFVLPVNVTGGSTSASLIAEYTRTVRSGNHFLLTGLGLAGVSFPFLRNGRFVATTVSTGDAEKAAVRLPNDGEPYDFALAWVMAADGITAPVALNKATLTWGQEQAAEGLTISVMGRNLAHGGVRGGASYLAVQSVAGGEVRLLTGTAVNPYRAEFRITGLPVGTYKAWPHNGHGGDYGWGKSYRLQVLDVQDHALTRNYGPAVALTLSPNPNPADATANTIKIQQALDTQANFTTPAGTYYINKSLSVSQDARRWACADPTGFTTLVADASWAGNDFGMLGTNGVRLLSLEGLEFTNPTNVALGADALVVLRGCTQLALTRCKGRWTKPYDVINYGSYSIPETAQALRFENCQHVYARSLSITGTGSHVGSRRGGLSRQIFFTDYRHRLTNGSDYTLYGLNTNGLCIVGFDFQDLDPASGDGLTRGNGRGLKLGGQGGANQNCHAENFNGRLLGPLFTGANPFYDRNQGEIFLWEGNRTTWQNYVVSATATTLTFAQPVLSRLVDVQNEVLRADDPAAGVLPGLHLLRIARGQGLWQVRGIASVSGNAITLDEPLNVVPNSTSLIQAGCFTRGNTVVDCRVSGKRFIVDDSEFGILCGINYYGGMHDTIVDNLQAVNVRHGFIFTPTVHADGEIDGNYFCELRDSACDGVRWGVRYESYGKEEEPTYHFPCSGLGAILVSNVRVGACLQDKIIFKTPRLASDVTTYWSAPPIDLLVIENG